MLVSTRTALDAAAPRPWRHGIVAALAELAALRANAGRAEGAIFAALWKTLVEPDPLDDGADRADRRVVAAVARLDDAALDDAADQLRAMVDVADPGTVDRALVMACIAELLAAVDERDAVVADLDTELRRLLGGGDGG